MKVLIVDDRPVIIFGCRAMLAACEDIAVIEAANVFSGKSRTEIAGLIDVSYNSVAYGRARLQRRLAANTPIDLVRIAVENRLV